MNGTFGFDHPLVLYAFIAFVPVFLGDFFSRKRKKEKRLSAALQKRVFLSTLFFRICAACLLIALAGPHWGTPPKGGASSSEKISSSAGVSRRGLDVVFAIDVSRSMDIRDVSAAGAEGFSSGEISRLERGLAVSREAAASLSGARFAAAAGRSRGLATVPLTWDNEAVLAFLESLDGSALTGGGTNLEALVDSAAGVFQNSFPFRRVIVLVSDGETLTGSLKAAADRCAVNEITLVPFALGSDTGSPVPGMDGVTSRRDFALMRMAAERTGGICIDGNGEDAAARLVSHLRSLAPESNTGSGRPESAARWHLFVIAAIIAYGIYKASPFAPRVRPAGGIK